MRILHISHPGRPLYERQWLHAAAHGDLVTVVPLHGRFPPGAGTIRLPVRRPVIGRLFSSTASPSRYVGLHAALVPTEADVIVTLELFSTTSHQGFEESRRLHVPLAVLVYELLDSHPIYRIPPFQSIANQLAQSADLFVCVSNKAADHLRKHGVPLSRIAVVSPGVDTDMFRPSDTSVRREGLIFVGHLAPHKGLPELLTAFTELSHQHVGLHLTLVGDGPLRSQVLDLSRAMTTVSYLGPLTPPAVARALRGSAIFVAPSVDTYRLRQRVGAEQFAFSVVEAMASGLAIVASDCGALSEVVPQPNPIVPQRDPRALADALDTLLVDAGRLAALQEANRDAAVQRYSLKRQAEHLALTLAAATSP